MLGIVQPNNSDIDFCVAQIVSVSVSTITCTLIVKVSTNLRDGHSDPQSDC